MAYVIAILVVISLIMIYWKPILIIFLVGVGIVIIAKIASKNQKNGGEIKKPAMRNSIFVKPSLPPRNAKSIYVEKHSKVCAETDKINEKYRFFCIKSFEYSISCDTLREYQKLDCVAIAKGKLDLCYNDVLQCYKESQENKKKWGEYIKEYDKIDECTAVEDIKKLPNRKMSVSAFRILEKQFYAAKKKTCPTTTFSLTCKITYRSPQGRNSYKKEHKISYQEIEAKIKEKEKYEKQQLDEKQKQKEIAEKRKKEEAVVSCGSKVYQELFDVNKRFCFCDIKQPEFEVSCKSYSQYDNFSALKHFKKQYLEKDIIFNSFFEKVERNRQQYERYVLEYQRCMEKLPSKCEGELKNMTLEHFSFVEKQLCEKAKLHPVTEKVIIYAVEYTSPSGRNSYKKQVRLFEKDIAKGLEELKEEAAERRKVEMLKELRAKEQAEMRALLKRKEVLEQKEEALAAREQEFRKATQGHIYAISENTPSSTPALVSVEERPSGISTWEKMKILKKSYEDGEITYQEYNEKRKQLF